MPQAKRLQPLTDEQRRTVEANLGLVNFVLDRLSVTGSEREDRWQDGCLGLMRAVQLYDPTIARFSTYAYKWIHNGIARGRATELGGGYRRTRRAGNEWKPPARLPGGDMKMAAPSPEPTPHQELRALGLTDRQITILTAPYAEVRRHYGMKRYQVTKCRRLMLAELCRR